jgi:hypothetical protein
MNKIFLAEPNFLQEYLQKTLNLSFEIKKAFNLSQEELLAFESQDSSVEPSPLLTIKGDGAQISIKGFLSSTPLSFCEKFFGIQKTCFDDIMIALGQVEGNSSINKLRLLIDSPGGEVKGQDVVFQKIFSLRDKMEIIAESRGTIASGAYWLASAAHEIVASAPSDEIGSIGVCIVTVDASKFEEEMGFKTVRIVSKNAPNKVPSVSEKKGLAVIQKRVDNMEAVFIDRISQGRGLDKDFIVDNFGGGALFVAQLPGEMAPDALSSKMIDSVITGIKQNKNIPSKGLENNSASSELEAGDKKNLNLHEKEKRMKFQDLMGSSSSDEDLKNEVTAALEAAKKEGTESGKQDFLKSSQRVVKVLTGDNKYPDAIKNLGLRVLAGEEDVSSFVAAVTVYDANQEKISSDAAEEENGEATAAENHEEQTAEGMIINSEKDLPVQE